VDKFLIELCYSFASSYGSGGDRKQTKDFMGGSLPDMSGKVYTISLIDYSNNSTE